jgi:Ca-activated chloride channel family protein
MNSLSQLRFADPQWLWLAAAAPALLIALQRYAARARQRQLRNIAAPQLLGDLIRSHSPGRRWIKNTMLIVATAAIGIALARPQWGVQEIAMQQAGEDIMFVMDCSRSMLASDVPPNRLERSRLAVLQFVRRLGDRRVGLVAFAGQAFLQCPLTYDEDAFEEALRALDDKTIPVPGTDIGRALDEAYRAMDKNDRRKIIVLITDGEDLEKSGTRIATALAGEGVVVYAIGVGTSEGSEIRVANERGQMEFVRDTKGGIVRSRLDETTLRAVASVTHGNYFPLGPLGEGLTRVRLEVDRNAGSESSLVQKSGVDRFHVPVGIALVFLVSESLLGTRRRKLPAN